MGTKMTVFFRCAPQREQSLLQEKERNLVERRKRLVHQDDIQDR